jgi:hypothetical protein
MRADETGRLPSPPPLPGRLVDDGLRVFVRLTPKSQLDGLRGLFTGPDGPRLDLRVRAAPESGAANDATTRLIASLLDVPRTSVRLAQGATSRYKAFDILGEGGALAIRLAALLAKQDG